MKPVIIAASTLTIFVLAIATFSTAGVAGASPTNSGHCTLCHPTPHPDGWVQQGHVALTMRSTDEMAECTRCHAGSFCSGCHAANGVSSAAAQ